MGRPLNEFPGGEYFARLDQATGELVVTTSMYGLDPDRYPGEDIEWIEEPQDDRWLPDEARRKRPDWMEDERRLVEAICADEAGRYVGVPIGVYSAAPGILDAFAGENTEGALRDEVPGAIRGRGAFRRVKDALHRRGQIGLWHRYEEQRQLRRARECLRGQGIEPDEPESPRPALRLVGEDEDG